MGIDVDWNTAATNGCQALAQLDGADIDKLLGLPLVKRSNVDGLMGNIWRCDQLFHETAV